MSSDRVHPDDAGYVFKESQYFPALLPIVKECSVSEVILTGC
jgi:hypothetical protein